MAKILNLKFADVYSCCLISSVFNICHLCSFSGMAWGPCPSQRTLSYDEVSNSIREFVQIKRYHCLIDSLDNAESNIVLLRHGNSELQYL